MEAEHNQVRAWKMYAHYDAAEGRFLHVGPRPYTEAHGTALPVVPVNVAEVGSGLAGGPDGSHYGWIDGNRGAPSMIHDHEGLFRMCFPHGPEAEEERGRGRVVRLAVGLPPSDDG